MEMKKAFSLVLLLASFAAAQQPQSGPIIEAKRVASSASLDSSKEGVVLTKTRFTSTSGLFTIAHSLGYKPTVAWVVIQGAGVVNFQYPLAWDADTFYLQGSASGIHGLVVAIK
jgi:hypothetical protein